MDLPNENNLTSKEASARIVFADNDNSSSYPGVLNDTFREILELARILPPSVDGRTSLAHITGDDTAEHQYENIHSYDQGY